MSVKRPLISVGTDKDGGMDFAINIEITELNHRDMVQLRNMICCAIAEAETIWRDAFMRKPENQARKA